MRTKMSLSGLTVVLLLLGVSGSAFGLQLSDLTRFGFAAEPGIALGTPCGVNAVGRFWLGYFGVSASGLYLPTGVNFLNGNGYEGALWFRLNPKAKRVSPEFGIGYGQSNVRVTVSGKSYGLATRYVGAFGGFTYKGIFANVGLGIGSFKAASSPKLPVVPLFKLGYVKGIRL